MQTADPPVARLGGNRATHDGGREWDAPNASHTVCRLALPWAASRPQPSSPWLYPEKQALETSLWRQRRGACGPWASWRVAVSQRRRRGPQGEAEAHLWRSVPLNHPAAGGGNHECTKVVRGLGIAKGLGFQV